MLVALALGGAAAALAQQAAGGGAASRAPQSNDPKSMSGMSILGNQEAPKSLVIVPWKSSEIGNGIGVSRALDTRIRAVDKDVFMRELKYYAIRSGARNSARTALVYVKCVVARRATICCRRNVESLTRVDVDHASARDDAAK